MSIVIRTGESNASDELRNLRNWLSDEPELHGLVTAVEQPIAPGHLGGVFGTLSVAVASGGALTVLASSVIVWLRQRTSDITLDISNGSQHVKLRAMRVQSLAGNEAQELIKATAEVLDSHTQTLP